MSGYIEAQLIILCLSIIYAYGIFLPAASGQLNLGAAGFITLGAYASAWFNASTGASLPIWSSVILAMLFTGVIAFVISFPILRTRGVYMVLATFAFAEVVSGIAINLEFVGGAAGFPVDGHTDVKIIVPVNWALISAEVNKQSKPIPKLLIRFPAFSASAFPCACPSNRPKS